MDNFLIFSFDYNKSISRKKNSSFVVRVKLIEAAEDVHYARSCQRVENLCPPALVRQQPSVAEHREVVRHRRHIQADEFGEFGHAALARTQRIHDEEPVRVAQRLEDIRPFAEIGRSLTPLGLCGFAGRYHILILCQFTI